MKIYEVQSKNGQRYTYRATGYKVMGDGTLVLLASHDGTITDAVFVAAPGEWQFVRVIETHPELTAGEFRR